MGGATAIEVFGPYLVYEQLGVGGMAMVHRAKKRGIAGFERVVALKRMLPHTVEDVDAVRSFVREAKLVAELRHTNIANVYELGLVGKHYFIAMEYVEGYSLIELLRCANQTGIPLPINVALAVLIELCDALEHAHTRVDDLTGEGLGIIHRDVSPSNLIITHAGNLKVIDFGVAVAEPNPQKTRRRRIKGKFGYMSPEALRGDLLDARSDIFSTGVVAHELLTARRLFGATSIEEGGIERGEVGPPSVLNPRVPAELDSVVLTAVASQPEQRWESAGAMRDALHGVARKHGLLATCDQTAEWLDYTFGGPEITFAPAPIDLKPHQLEADTEVDSLFVMSPPTFSGHTPTFSGHTPTLR